MHYGVTQCRHCNRQIAFSFYRSLFLENKFISSVQEHVLFDIFRSSKSRSLENQGRQLIPVIRMCRFEALSPMKQPINQPPPCIGRLLYWIQSYLLVAERHVYKLANKCVVIRVGLLLNTNFYTRISLPYFVVYVNIEAIFFRKVVVIRFFSNFNLRIYHSELI